MTHEAIEQREGLVVTQADREAQAYLYESEDGSKELILDCNGEYARRLLENGYTETPLFAEADTTSLEEERDTLAKRVAGLEAALEWYGQQARLCRLIHSEGDSGRHALQADGGNRARAALNTDPSHAE